MSADLNVWSNHSLRFNSFKEGIGLFENQVLKKLKQRDFRNDVPLVTTSVISEVEYFTDFNILQHNFANWNIIRIQTNFEFCDEIKLLGQSINLDPKGFYTRFNKWQELVIGDFEQTNELARMIQLRNNWISFHEFSKLLTCKLGGNKVLFLDDQGYQIQEDKFNEGGSLEEVFELLKKVKAPSELEELKLFPNDIHVKHTWYYENLKK